MLVERDLNESDIPLLALIDRTEQIDECYRLEHGELVLYAAHHDMRGWPEGEAEQDALELHACWLRTETVHPACDETRRQEEMTLRRTQTHVAAQSFPQRR